MIAFEGPDTFGVCIGFGTDQIVVGVSGELDMSTAAQLGDVLAVVVDPSQANIVLDLAELEFIDAAGLRVIAATSTRLHESGRMLRLRSVPAMTNRVLTLTGMDKLVRIEPSHWRVPLGREQRSGDRSRVVTSQPVDPVDLAAVAKVPAADEVVDAALRLVVALAKATVGGADGVSVSLDRRGRLRTVAATDETIMQMDRDQYATAQGPCVAAAAEGRWFHVQSLAAETRWPEFVPRAIEGGIGSILSTPLLVGARSVGALNIYSTAEAAFGGPEQDLAAMFASQASGILASARTDAGTEEFGRRLQGGLRVREVIAQAQGVLMERTGSGADEASATHRRSAADAYTSLRQSAADIVASARREPAPSPRGTDG